MTRRAFFSLITVAVSQTVGAEKRDLRSLIEAIGKQDAEYSKVVTLISKRQSFFNPKGDAVICGWFRRLGELSHKTGDCHEEVARILCE